MYIMNNNGPRIDPCGIPQTQSTCFDEIPLTDTLCDLFENHGIKFHQVLHLSFSCLCMSLSPVEHIVLKGSQLDAFST